MHQCLMIESSLILPTLRKFVEDRKRLETAEEVQDKNDASIFRSSRTLNAEDVQQFWKSIQDTAPQHNYRLWKSLENGLIEYLSVSLVLSTHKISSVRKLILFHNFIFNLQVLKKRGKLDSECEYLRQQNLELKHLLQRYMPFNDKSNDAFDFD